MSTPEKLSLEDLEKLLLTADTTGNQPIDSTELRQIVDEMCAQLEPIQDKLCSFMPDNVLHERWKFIEQAKRSLRSTIRNLKRSVRTQ